MRIHYKKTKIAGSNPFLPAMSFHQSSLMKFSINLVLFFFIAIGALAQKSETRELGNFKGIKVGEAIDVYLKKGANESAKVVVERVDLEDVLTEVSGGYLKVHMRNNNYRNRGSVKVYVTYVTLERISASSAASVISDGTIKANTLDIVASSAANVELSVDAEEMSVDVGSAGDVRLEGKARSITIEASSAGSIDAYDLECEKVDAEASSAGSAKITVTKSLRARASSGGSVRYRGNPTSSNTDASSGGSVKKSS